MESESVDEKLPEPTKDSSKSITAIDQDTVQRICSGQVIISLAVAVKELVENSLDAGATIIEVKLKEFGLESIEVSDNGYGVQESDFEGLTSRYNTSKIKDFTDLQFVETFGFRGEALNSLCALSDMTIITRHGSVEIGTKLELDHKGSIIKRTPYPRQVGTTVTMKNLFSTLPVRKKDYAKNIKKEFTKMCQILQGYCLISSGVRILCSNQTSKNGRITFMSTNGSTKIIDNIQSIFGTKQLTDLMKIQPPLDDNEKFTKDNLLDSSLLDSNKDSNFNITDNDIEKLNQINFNIDGWISSCAHGRGRNARDRQYFFINSRPCDPKSIIKLVNDIYHRYNSHQYPFVFLNINLEKTEIDVNLTPDKRMLLLNNEKLLLLVLKKSLLRTFGTITTSFKIQQTKLDLILKNCDERNIMDVDSDDEIKLLPNSQKFQENLQKWKATGTTDGPYKPTKCIKRKESNEIQKFNEKVKKIQNILLSQNIPSPSTLKSSPSKQNENKKSYHFRRGGISSSSSSSSSDSEECSPNIKKLKRSNSNISELEAQSKEFDILTQRNQPSCSKSEPKENDDLFSDDFQTQETNKNDYIVRQIDCKVKKIESTSPKLIIESTQSTKSDNSDSDDEEIENMTPTQFTILDTSDNENDDDNIDLSNSDEIDITIDDIRNLVIEEEKLQENLLNAKKTQKLINKFNAEINPNKNHKAEEELKREITKDMFKNMKIIGQFNLGFIIVKLDENLFIIDQHATDEKYNFETLQKTTNLQYQPLTIPQNLELPAINEMILIDNIKIFEANGFRFQIDDTAPVTKKIKLIGKPYSRNWEFDKNDIDELIFMLQFAPEGSMCRPSRIRDMFASRACRSSVMIGKALNHKIMRKLIDHMGEIENPWNCPHGRPTMRHLINLDMLVDDDEEEEEEEEEEDNSDDNENDNDDSPQNSDNDNNDGNDNNDEDDDDDNDDIED